MAEASNGRITLERPAGTAPSTAAMKAAIRPVSCRPRASIDPRVTRPEPRIWYGQIEHFFVSYNEMKGKQFKVKGQAGKRRALTLVTAALTKRGRR